MAGILCFPVACLLVEYDVHHGVCIQDVEIQLGQLRALLADRQIDLRLTERAMRWLAETGYDPVYGARPLKRTLQRELQDPLALKILGGEFGEDDTVEVDANEDGLYFVREEKVAEVASNLTPLRRRLA